MNHNSVVIMFLSDNQHLPRLLFYMDNFEIVANLLWGLYCAPTFQADSRWNGCQFHVDSIHSIWNLFGWGPSHLGVSFHVYSIWKFNGISIFHGILLWNPGGIHHNLIHGFHIMPHGFHIIPHGFHIFHMDSTLCHMDSILFHMDSTLFYMDSTLFHMDSTLFHMDSTLFHMDSTLFHNIPHRFHIILHGFHNIPHGFHTFPHW